MTETALQTLSLPAAITGTTPFARFVITGVYRSSEKMASLLGLTGDQEVRLTFDEQTGALLIQEGEVVRAPRFNELRDLRKVLDAWVAAASRVPELVQRFRVGVTELLTGPAKLEQFALEGVDRVAGHVILRGTAGKRGTATVSYECSTGELSIRYEAYAGAPSRVRSLKVSELVGLAQALESSNSLALEDVRDAVQIEFDIVSGERPDPTLGQD